MLILSRTARDLLSRPEEAVYEEVSSRWFLPSLVFHKSAFSWTEALLFFPWFMFFLVMFFQLLEAHGLLQEAGRRGSTDIFLMCVFVGWGGRCPEVFIDPCSEVDYPELLWATYWTMAHTHRGDYRELAWSFFFLLFFKFLFRFQSGVRCS